MKLGDNGEAFFVEEEENMDVSWTTSETTLAKSHFHDVK